MRMAAKSWSGEWWKHGGGGTVWNAISYDAETDTLFIGTGNGAPWNHRVRSEGKGDNLFLCSIVALDGKTGAYKWHYQQVPGDTWDYNAAMDMHLAELMIDGRPHKVIVQAPKNGFLYVIDRLNGKLISAEKIATKVTWATHVDLRTGRPVETPMVRFPNGGIFELWPGNRGNMAINLAEQPVKDPLKNSSALLAWDPIAGKPAWRLPTPGPGMAGSWRREAIFCFRGVRMAGSMRTTGAPASCCGPTRQARRFWPLRSAILPEAANM